VVRDKDSAESFGPIPDVASGRLSILGGRMNTAGAAGVCLLLVDLLNISGGLSRTVTTAQTTGLPTAALTRFTGGEGVMIQQPENPYTAGRTRRLLKVKRQSLHFLPRATRSSRGSAESRA
jgi:hypothetical protein